MKNTGLIPTFVQNKKNYSYHKTFGSVQQFLPELNYDKGLGDDFQGNTTFCTAYTVEEIGSDQDGVLYDVNYQMAKTVELMNADPKYVQGADLFTSLSVPVVIGYLPDGDAPVSWKKNGQVAAQDPNNYPITLDPIARKNSKIAFFQIELLGDWFDSIRSTIALNQTPIAIATPWYLEYARVQSDGILPIGVTQESWHSTEIVGWKVIQGATYLICKSHQGKNIGDKGYVYFSRDEINRIMSVSGSVAGVLTNLTSTNENGVEIKTISTSYFEQLVGYYKMFRWYLSHVSSSESSGADNQNLLYQTAKACLDTCMVAPGVDIEVGCASSVNDVYTKAFGHQIGGGASTYELLQSLINSTDFYEVDTPMPGDIIISATGTSKLNPAPYPGHTGVVGAYGIMSNNSYNGLWQEYYTIDTWEQRYQVGGGYPTRFFRRK